VIPECDQVTVKQAVKEFEVGSRAALRWAVFPVVGNIGMGIKEITITSETATYQNFQVSYFLVCIW
jgi:hypothetical protein